MLLPLLLLMPGPAGNGIQRFHDFMERTKSFSVQLTTKTEHIPLVGKGSYTVLAPGSFRLTMNWGTSDYNYVKNPAGAVEFERYIKTYQEYPVAKGLDFDESAFAASQMDSLPLSLIGHDLKRFVPQGTPFALVSKSKGVETYSASWSANGASGKVVAVIGPDGRLLHFDHLAQNPMSRIHRVTDFSGYVLNPKLSADTFSTIPPLGFTCYQFQYPDPTLNVGDILHLGTWQSSTGPVDVDSALRGKLVVVRESDSAPADALMQYLGNEKLPVGMVVLSLSNSGGQYWSPTPAASKALSTYGTPLMILVGQDGKAKAMWLGFDPENPKDLAAAITNAAKGTAR